MSDRYKLSQFNKGKDFEIPYIQIRRFDDPKINSENIFIICLQPNYPNPGTKKEKELIDNWKKTFKLLDNVKRLKVNIGRQEIFDSVCEIPNLEELFIEASDITDLSQIKNLTRLTRFQIRYNSKLKNISHTIRSKRN